MILYFRLPYIHVSTIALFSTYYLRTLILYKRSLDLFCLHTVSTLNKGDNFRQREYFRNTHENAGWLCVACRDAGGAFLVS